MIGRFAAMSSGRFAQHEVQALDSQDVLGLCRITIWVPLLRMFALPRSSHSAPLRNERVNLALVGK